MSDQPDEAELNDGLDHFESERDPYVLQFSASLKTEFRGDDPQLDIHRQMGVLADMVDELCLLAYRNDVRLVAYSTMKPCGKFSVDGCVINGDEDVPSDKGDAIAAGFVKWVLRKYGAEANSSFTFERKKDSELL